MRVVAVRVVAVRVEGAALEAVPVDVEAKARLEWACHDHGQDALDVTTTMMMARVFGAAALPSMRVLADLSQSSFKISPADGCVFLVCRFYIILP